MFDGAFTPAAGPAPQPPTERQAGFYSDLVRRYRARTGTDFDDSGYDLDARSDVSAAIDAIKLALAAAPSRRPEPREPGYYAAEDGTLIQVVLSRQGRTYAKVFHDEYESWEYTPGGMDLIARPATLDEVADKGRAFGFCLVCNRTLTDPESIERGIGPVCATRFGVADPATDPVVADHDDNAAEAALAAEDAAETSQMMLDFE